MIVNKPIDLPLLHAQLTSAGVIVPGLGTRPIGAATDVHTYDAAGLIVDLPPAAAPVVDAHVAPPPITDYACNLPVSGRKRTTDATVTEVYRLTLDSMTGYRARATLLGVDAGNGAVRMIDASIVVKRLGAGALLVGSPVVVANHADAAAATWAITAAVAGNDLVISVTGAAGRTIDWLLEGDILAFAPAGLG